MDYNYLAQRKKIIKQLNIDAQTFISVSYTHLDVYKRQQLHSVFVMHGVNDKMVVQVCKIGVGGHQHLMSRPRFFRKRQTDFVYLLGGHTFIQPV